MSYTVTVVFGGEREYEFSLHDAEVAKTAANADYAGDADPYLHPHEDDEQE